MYKLIFYVPEPETEQVKRAVFDAGAGRLGNYDSCSWQTKGIGQFRPLVGSQPSIGNLNALEVVEENRVEILCTRDVIHTAITALKHAHPYEEPAFEVIALVNPNSLRD